jgi:hypothetical protein
MSKSFSIKKSHKYTDQFGKGKDESKTGSSNNLLTNDDYMLFDITNDKLMGSGKQAVAEKSRKGGNYIHPVNVGQEDYF